MRGVFHKESWRTSGGVLSVVGAGLLAAALTAGDWPVRDTACLEALRDGTPRDYYRLKLDGSKTIDQISAAHAKLVTRPYMTVTFNEIVGPGLLRVVSDPNQPDPDDLKA